MEGRNFECNEQKDIEGKHDGEESLMNKKYLFCNLTPDQLLTYGRYLTIVLHTNPNRLLQDIRCQPNVVWGLVMLLDQHIVRLLC